MADMDLIDRARNAVNDRAELPGMSLMQHLEELRRMLIHSVIGLVVGMGIAWGFYSRIEQIIAAPITRLGLHLTQLHPTDAVNFAVKISLYGGAIIASRGRLATMRPAYSTTMSSQIARTVLIS